MDIILIFCRSLNLKETKPNNTGQCPSCFVSSLYCDLSPQSGGRVIRDTFTLRGDGEVLKFKIFRVVS